MRTIVRLLVVLVPLLGAAACTELDPPAGEETFSETSVWLSPDGTTRVTERTITAREQRAQIEARDRAAAGEPGAQPLIAEDSACAGASLWLFDQVDLQGNKICFAGKGVTDLEQYPRWLCDKTTCYTLTWQLEHGGSYYSGTESGVIYSQDARWPWPLVKLFGHYATGNVGPRVESVQLDE